MGTQTAETARILLVEDEPTIARVCARVLAGEGIGVDIAEEGGEALEMMKGSTYDLVLTDIKMPGMSGIEFYERLERESPELTDRVVFTTGDVLGGGTADFLRRVRKPLLEKPFTTADLRNTVCGTLDRTRRQALGADSLSSRIR